MSDPVTQSELEDVLAAIRRLVSEERQDPPRRTEEPAAADKLVLTPALMVQDDPGDPDAAARDGPDRDRPAPGDAEDGGPLSEPGHREAVDGPAMTPVAPEIEADGMAPPDAPEPAATEGGAAAARADMPPVREPSDGAARGAAVDEDEPADAPETTAGPEERDPRLSGSAGGSPDPAAQTDGGRAESPGDAEEEPSTGAVRTEIGDPFFAGADHAGWQSPDAAEPAEPTAAEGVAARRASLEGKIAELEAMVGMSDGDWEHEAAAEHAPAADMGWHDDAASTTAEDPSDWDAAQDEEPPLDVEETILDEEMLRDMVAEIVRQELQGELGERITRNVRKLVRREIHRALAAQVFD